MFLLLATPFSRSGATVRSGPAAYRSPVDIPLLLSGNFGEPRPRHFHAGIDVKTQGVTGKTIRAVSDGYVSRITVGKFGYGNALYVTHTDGLTSVYCHLECFAPALQEILHRWQSTSGQDVVDMPLPPGVVPVHAGDAIAVSGNTGASLAPHLHLELRRSADGLLIDPLPYFRNLLTDTRPPCVRGVKLYPARGRGVVRRSSEPFVLSGDALLRGQPVVEAWGDIGVGLWAEDRMDGTNNRFGVYAMRLTVDGREVFASRLDTLCPADHPLVDAWGDHAHFRRTQTWYLRSFALPGCRMPRCRYDENGGRVRIDEERDYRFEYVLSDRFGNTTTCAFTVRGVHDETTDREMRTCRMRDKGNARRYLRAGRYEVVQVPGMELRLPPGALPDDLPLRPACRTAASGLSALYTLHDEPVALLRPAELWLKPRHKPTDLRRCYVESEHGYVGGEAVGGWIKAFVSRLGERYALAVDTTPPHLELLESKQADGSVLRYRVSDRQTGVGRFRAEMDGIPLLFRVQGAVRICRLTDTAVRATGGRRRLRVVAVDRCGNEAVDERSVCY